MWKRLLAVLLVLPISLYGTFWAFTLLLTWWDEAWRPAWIGDGRGAEAIAILPTGTAGGFSAELIPFSFAKTFASKHTQCTFLIPVDRRNEVLNELKTKQGLPWLSLQVTQLTEGKQEVLIEDMDRTDDTHGTRYEASRADVILRSSRFIGDRDAMGVLLVAMALSAIVNFTALAVLAGLAIHRWRKRTP